MSCNPKLNSRGRLATLPFRGHAAGHVTSHRCTVSRPANLPCRCRAAARPPSHRSNSTHRPVGRRSRPFLHVRSSCRSSTRRCTSDGRFRWTRAVLGRAWVPSGIRLCTNCRPTILWCPCPREYRRSTVPVGAWKHFSLSMRTCQWCSGHRRGGVKDFTAYLYLQWLALLFSILRRN